MLVVLSARYSTGFQGSRGADGIFKKKISVLWATGAVLSLIHAWCAFAYFHESSHVVAFESTANKVEALFGFRFGYGIYFNYLFNLIWIVDAAWWITMPKTYQARNSTFDWTIDGFLLFIAINGAVVFAPAVAGIFSGLILILFTGFTLRCRWLT